MRGQKQDLMKQKHNFQNTSQHNARTVLLSIYKERLLTTWNYTYRNLECVHTLPDRFSAAWKKILVRAFVHIRERLWWRDSVMELSCAAPISKEGRHISESCSLCLEKVSGVM